MAQAQKAVKQDVPLSDILVGDSYLNFINSLKTDSTKECYKNALLRFMKFFDIKNTQTLATLTSSEFEFYLKKYLLNQQQNNSSYNSMSMITNTVNHFCTMNDIMINSRKIAKFKTPTGNGKGRGQEQDEAYSHEEIQKLLNVAPLRMKVCILVFASTGIRKGALASIQRKHIEKISVDNNVYKITLYPGTRDQYIGFTTPECSKTIDEYFEYRTRLGEELNPDSYLIREDFDITDIEQIRLKSRRISDRTISSGFYALSIKAGTRQRTSDKFTRKRVALLHGFRKFFTTQLINSKLDPEKREMLLGHRIGLTSAYYRPTEQEMLAEFEKAIDALTIEPSQRLQRKVETLLIEKSNMDRIELKLQLLEKQFNERKGNS